MLLNVLTSDISSLEPKATIEDAPRDSPKFNTVKNIVLESVSDRQVNQFMQVEKVQLIKNQFLEYKVSDFCPLIIPLLTLVFRFHSREARFNQEFIDIVPYFKTVLSSATQQCLVLAIQSQPPLIRPKRR